MKLKLLLITLVLFIIPMDIASAALVSCNGVTEAHVVVDGKEVNMVKCDFCELIKTINNVVGWILLIGGIIGGIVIMYGGWVMMSAGANESGHAKGKGIVTNAVIGTVILFSAVALITVLLAALMNLPITPGSLLNGIKCGEFASNGTDIKQAQIDSVLLNVKEQAQQQIHTPGTFQEETGAVIQQEQTDLENSGYQVIGKFNEEAFEISERPDAVDAFADACEAVPGGEYRELGGDGLGALERICVTSPSQGSSSSNPPTVNSNIGGQSPPGSESPVTPGLPGSLDSSGQPSQPVLDSQQQYICIINGMTVTQPSPCPYSPPVYNDINPSIFDESLTPAERNAACVADNPPGYRYDPATGKCTNAPLNQSNSSNSSNSARYACNPLNLFNNCGGAEGQCLQDHPGAVVTFDYEGLNEVICTY